MSAKFLRTELVLGQGCIGAHSVLHGSTPYAGNNVINVDEIIKDYRDEDLRFVSFRGTENNIVDFFRSLHTLMCVVLKRKVILFTIPPSKLNNKIWNQ